MARQIELLNYLRFWREPLAIVELDWNEEAGSAISEQSLAREETPPFREAPR